MSETEITPQQTLSSLTDSLDVLEKAFEPLVGSSASTWTETISALPTLERAKMDVLVAYAINDLIWVYLKTKGIDPEKHDVAAELERIKTYYAKVRAIEEPETQRPQINSAAAKRFIHSSLPRSQHLPPPTSAAQLASDQARRAVAEQEEEESLRRVGKAGRFRFIDQEGGAEKIIPGHQADGGDDDLGEAEGEDEDDEMDGSGDRTVTQAEEFLRDLEEEMNA
ncbi:hypothetical protein CI109_101843 [Kwoniella shandongensis]|uniref:Exosome complex protein n=1 Tax=Kwoniella shandongensis TaxID=1734106 RepID=A0A5M6BPF7_9TREE|nr:uncharacterized protein CI109_007019 [Kwoniella shandongensis]KAA5524633.1 hypothetical protein CI109_007019 [Kwoniella shandongensis]